MELRSKVHCALGEEDETSLSHCISSSLHLPESSTSCRDGSASSSCTMECTGLSTNESNWSCLQTQLSPREVKWKPLLTTFARDSLVKGNPGDVTGTGVLSSSTTHTAYSPEEKSGNGHRLFFCRPCSARVLAFSLPRIPTCDGTWSHFKMHSYTFNHAITLDHNPESATRPRAQRRPW